MCIILTLIYIVCQSFRGEVNFISFLLSAPPPSLFQFHVNFEEVKWV